ncbi:LPS export ABC transporter permease LptG [Aliishimia ponticola]|uniref:LPS export ABC transporter permease LptG n=1 Tax=Aliishimia ponticola TaxID=2499833 RepID=A0A4S4NFS4_9RHOB|nr:LPS export ABC transporter permease LptG [Aliishimia ponticola]THH38444.1 LPS export ABC transporter permease LptG [Aliishimia ponticola]
MILHMYFARRFFMGFLGLTIVLYALSAVVELFELLGDFGTAPDVSFPQILGLLFLRSPGLVDQILPLILLLATIMLFIGLARTSELVVTRAAGRSAIRSLIAPVVVALVIGVLAVTMLGPIIAAFSNRYAALSEGYRTGGNAALSVSGEGLWLRQGDTNGQTVIRAARSNADGSVLYDVTFLSYAPQVGPNRRIEAASAELTDGHWVLTQAKEWNLQSGTNAEAEALRHARLELPSSLTVDRIRESLGSSSGVSIWEMQGFIAQLEHAGFSARRHQVWFQSQLSRPLFLAAMVLVGAAFTMRHTRFGGTGPAVLAAVLLGFALYFIRSFAVILGENGQLAVPLATWAVPVAANLLALGLLLHAEDG